MASSTGGARLKSASGGLAQALADKAAGSLGNGVSGLADRLEDVVSGKPSAKAALGSGTSAAKGESPVVGALKGAASAVKDKIPGLGGSRSSGSKGAKATNIIEQIDVGVPVRVAYDQWTEFGSFPTFMKKVEKVEAEEDTKLSWRAQIVWSHRTWEATVLEQVPDERIVWRSSGQKGHVDGAVSFHELAPDLTRILVVLEYHPQGLFERTGNIWRAQGRRVRAELNNFQRQVMTQTVLDPDAVEGWRGTIRDGEVVQTHEDALAEEEAAGEEPEDEGEEYDDEGEGEAYDDEEYEEPEDSEDEGDEESEEDEEPEEPEDSEDEEYDDEDYLDEDEEPEDEEDEEPDEPEDEEYEDYEDEEPEDEDEEPEDEPVRPRSRRRAG